jgi:hypothetical protein
MRWFKRPSNRRNDPRRPSARKPLGEVGVGEATHDAGHCPVTTGACASSQGHVSRTACADFPHRDKMTILRGLLTAIRGRAEQGIPISLESIAQVEKLARNLESEERTS